MATDDKLTIESSPNASKPLEYPKSPDVQVNGSNLTIELIKFERAVKNRVSLPLTAAIVSLWAPFVTADFKPLFKFTANEVQAGYFVFASIMTLFIIKPLLVTVGRWIPWVPFYKQKFYQWVRDNECNPETKTNDIIQKCFPTKED